MPYSAMSDICRHSLAAALSIGPLLSERAPHVDRSVVVMHTTRCAFVFLIRVHIRSRPVCVIQRVVSFKMNPTAYNANNCTRMALTPLHSGVRVNCGADMQTSHHALSYACCHTSRLMLVSCCCHYSHAVSSNRVAFRAVHTSRSHVTPCWVTLTSTATSASKNRTAKGLSVTCCVCCNLLVCGRVQRVQSCEKSSDDIGTSSACCL
jgi:hypothetical protein